MSWSPGPRPAEPPSGVMHSRGCGAGPAAALRLGHVLRCFCCCCLSFLLVLAEPLTQLPAPHNQRIHLYNLEQVLSWDAVPTNNFTSPVLYSVEYKYSQSEWRSMECVNCTRIAEPVCNFTVATPPPCFSPFYYVSLRIKAELGELVSDWALVPWFQFFQNATIGPPLDIHVTSSDRSLSITLKPPFKVNFDTFRYHVYYWEKEGKQKIKSSFISQSIRLKDLNTPSEYCLQVQAELNARTREFTLEGLLSNITCHETYAEASTKLQQSLIIILGIFALILLVLGCYFLVQNSQGLIKQYFHSPPGIPSQIKERHWTRTAQQKRTAGIPYLLFSAQKKIKLYPAVI
ncbi:interferon gamma receptor 2 isoform X1 [Dromiciops gliroides]|uniref:interferon gamma receptor 2 isoform X1 n=1 Tax=Dromiciops gliroides TaxID=33562 RepID=UPI001CC7C27E|nr:interferon gamma receptor 2 isoform X1 [Dromiciops gliroides]